MLKWQIGSSNIHSNYVCGSEKFDCVNCVCGSEKFDCVSVTAQ